MELQNPQPFGSKLAPIIPNDKVDGIADAFRAYSIAENTRISYALSWDIYKKWCELHGRDHITMLPEGYEHFLIHLSKVYSFNTLNIIHYAVKWVFDNSTAVPDYPFDKARVRSLFTGIKQHKQRTEHEVQAPKFNNDVLNKISQECSNRSFQGIRDRCLMLLCYWCALRTDELVRIQVKDIEFFDGGLVVKIPSQKNHSRPMYKSIPRRDDKEVCPFTAYFQYKQIFSLQDNDYLASGNIDRHNNIKPTGLPMTKRRWGQIVKAYFKTVLGEELGGTFSPHSFRRSFVTDMLDRGVDPADISTQTHQSVQTIVDRYDANRHLIKRNFIHNKFNQ